MWGENMTEKQQFMKKVTIICDTREQENKHIITALDEMKISHENRKLDFGDYSFYIDGRDFSLSCIIERKGCIIENIEERAYEVKSTPAQSGKEKSSLMTALISFFYRIKFTAILKPTAKAFSSTS